MSSAVLNFPRLPGHLFRLIDSEMVFPLLLSGAAGLGLALLHLASGATIFRLEYVMFPNAKYPIVL